MKIDNIDALTFLEEVESNSVDLWMTSPPYAKQRDYNGASSNDYIDFISPIINEAKRTIKNTGSIFINIKEHCHKGQRDLYLIKLIIHCVEELGLRYVDEYIWYKTNPFPTGSKKRLKDGFERILHFTKSSDYKFYPNNVLIPSQSRYLESEKRRKNKGEHNTNNGSGMNMQRRVSTDLVRPSNVINGSSSNLNIGHPAVFPEYLPEFFIKLTTQNGDLVGDMFLGSGTTGIVAIKNNRDFIGCELDNNYYELSIARIKDELDKK